MKSKILFIPRSRDEERFIEVMDSLPNVNFVKVKAKHPFYTICEDKGILYVRKRRDDLCSKPYKKLLPDDAAALFLLPKEAVKEFIFSL